MGKAKKSSKHGSAPRAKQYQEDFNAHQAGISNMLNDLSHLDANRRETACTMLANICATISVKDYAFDKFSSADFLSKLTLRLVDTSPGVRLNAAGAVRNISAVGDVGVCTKMVEVGIPATLTSLMMESVSNASSLEGKQYMEQLFGAFRNISASSDIAVVLSNYASTVDVLLRTIVATQTVGAAQTEVNAEELKACSSLQHAALYTLFVITDNNADFCSHVAVHPLFGQILGFYLPCPSAVSGLYLNMLYVLGVLMNSLGCGCTFAAEMLPPDLLLHAPAQTLPGNKAIAMCIQGKCVECLQVCMRGTADVSWLQNSTATNAVQQEHYDQVVKKQFDAIKLCSELLANVQCELNDNAVTIMGTPWALHGHCLHSLGLLHQSLDAFVTNVQVAFKLSTQITVSLCSDQLECMDRLLTLYNNNLMIEEEGPTTSAPLLIMEDFISVCTLLHFCVSMLVDVTSSGSNTGSSSFAERINLIGTASDTTVASSSDTTMAMEGLEGDDTIATAAAEAVDEVPTILDADEVQRLKAALSAVILNCAACLCSMLGKVQKQHMQLPPNFTVQALVPVILRGLSIYWWDCVKACLDVCSALAVTTAFVHGTQELRPILSFEQTAVLTMSLLKRMQEPAVGQITQSSFTDILPVKCSMTTANVMMDLHAQDDLHIYNDIYKNAKFDVAGKLQNMIKIAAVKNQMSLNGHKTSKKYPPASHYQQQCDQEELEAWQEEYSEIYDNVLGFLEYKKHPPV